MGQFASARTYPTAAFRDVTAPNADTPYSSAWLDLSKEPYVLSLPDALGRYYLFPMFDAWTTVFRDPGTRTTDTGAQNCAITGPIGRVLSPPRDRIEIANQPGVDNRTDLPHRYA